MYGIRVRLPLSNILCIDLYNATNLSSLLMFKESSSNLVFLISTIKNVSSISQNLYWQLSCFLASASSIACEILIGKWFFIVFPIAIYHPWLYNKQLLVALRLCLALSSEGLVVLDIFCRWDLVLDSEVLNSKCFTFKSDLSLEDFYSTTY